MVDPLVSLCTLLMISCIHSLQGSQQEWQTVFFICAGVYLFAFLFYAIFASGEEQDWAKSSSDKCGESIQPLTMEFADSNSKM